MIFFVPGDLEIWWMTWKIIGHLFCAILSLVQHFKAISIFKLELQSGNAQFGSKLVIFFVPGDFENWRMNLKNNRTPLLYYSKLCASFQIHWWSQTWVTAWKRSSPVQIGIFFVLCDLENWRMTLKNNRAPLQYCFNLCASFHSQWWIQTGVTVRKRPIWVKIDNLFSRAALKFDRWPWRTIRYLFLATSSFVHHFIAICKFKLE